MYCNITKGFYSIFCRHIMGGLCKNDCQSCYIIQVGKYVQELGSNPDSFCPDTAEIVRIRQNPDPQHTHSELVVFIDFPPSSPFYCLNYWRIYIYIYIYRSCKFLLLYVPSTIRKYFTLP